MCGVPWSCSLPNFTIYITGCTAYDVVINPGFHSKIQKSELFNSFFLTIVFEGLESKYDIELERKWTVLKNKKSMGTLHPHCIRSKSKPVIMEMEDDSESSCGEGRRTLYMLALDISFFFICFFCLLFFHPYLTTNL